MNHGFYIGYDDMIYNLIDNLSKREEKLLGYMMKNRDIKTNCISFKKNSLDELNLKKQNFNTYKNNLIKKCFIVETNIKGQYMINPFFYYTRNSKQFDMCKRKFVEFKTMK